MGKNKLFIDEKIVKKKLFNSGKFYIFNQLI